MYNSITSQQGMFFDQNRNNAYFDALQAVITPDSVVLDLGAGMGIHGLLAAKLGAKKVYMVEPESVINVARQLAQGNGFSDRVECIQGKIENITLPQQVDVIVSVLTGNFLLQEDLLPSLFYARDKYLKTGGVMIPNAAVMETVPVSQPNFYEKQINIWSQTYFGLNFSEARKLAVNTVYYNRAALKKAEYLSRPETLMSIDFYNAQDVICKTTVEFQMTQDGLCHGLAGWFNIQLGDEWLSTAPHAPKVHWSPAFLPLTSPLELNKGDSFKLYLARFMNSDWVWRVTTESSDQKHSTFISRALSLKVFQADME